MFCTKAHKNALETLQIILNAYCSSVLCPQSLLMLSLFH